MTAAERLAEIEKRAEAATPGPWRAVPAGVDSDATGAAWVAKEGEISLAQGYDGEFLHRPDADFMAASRSDVPWLLEQVKQLRAERDEAREAVKHNPGNTAVLLQQRDHLRDERDALREALTPSGETKAAFLGEFRFDAVGHDVPVPWTTVKEIMAAILARASLPTAEPKGDGT